MNIVTVIPISRGIRKETLSYFTALDVPIGAMIKVPLRTKMVPGIVVEVRAAPDLKNEIRNAPFAIKKIGRTKFRPIFLPEFIAAAAAAAAHFAGSTGGVLASISPKAILEHAEKIKAPVWTAAPISTSAPSPESAAPAPTPAAASTPATVSTPAPASTETSGAKLEPMILQADEDDRLAHYKSLIRSEFALKHSVFFCVPTIQDAKRAFEALPKGIEDYAYVLNSSLTATELVNVWNKIVTEPHPVLIIATGTFFGVPRRDLGTIVIERESSTGYKSRTRPYLDIRIFAEILAEKIGARLIFGDILLRTETLWRTNNGEFTEVSPLKFRSLSSAHATIIDMKKYKTADAPEFRILSDEVEVLGHKTKENNERLFILAGRRGLAPLTVCGDCGTSVLCSRCSAPIVLHRLKKSDENAETARNIFLCHRCGERRDAAERCKVCGSWKLTTLGIGVELVEETLRTMFPKTTLFRIDKDATVNHRQALRTAATKRHRPGGRCRKVRVMPQTCPPASGCCLGAEVGVIRACRISHIARRSVSLCVG